MSGRHSNAPATPVGRAAARSAASGAPAALPLPLATQPGQPRMQVHLVFDTDRDLHGIYVGEHLARTAAALLQIQNPTDEFRVESDELRARIDPALTGAQGVAP